MQVPALGQFPGQRGAVDDLNLLSRFRIPEGNVAIADNRISHHIGNKVPPGVI